MLKTDLPKSTTRARSVGVPTQRLIGHCPTPAVCFDYGGFIKSLWGFDGDPETMPFLPPCISYHHHGIDPAQVVQSGLAADPIAQSHPAVHVQRSNYWLTPTSGTIASTKDKRDLTQILKSSLVPETKNANGNKYQSNKIPRSKSANPELENHQRVSARYLQTLYSELPNRAQIASKNITTNSKAKTVKCKYAHRPNGGCIRESVFASSSFAEMPGTQNEIKKTSQQHQRQSRKKSSTKESPQKLFPRSVSPSLLRNNISSAVSSQHDRSRSKSVSRVSKMAGKGNSSPMAIVQTASDKVASRLALLTPLTADEHTFAALNQNAAGANQRGHSRKKAKKVNEWAISLDPKPKKRVTRRRRTQKLPQEDTAHTAGLEQSEAKSFFIAQQDRMRAAALYSTASSGDPSYAEMPDTSGDLELEVYKNSDMAFVNRLAEDIEVVKIEDYKLKPKNTKRKKIVRRVSAGVVKSSPQQPVKDVIKEKAGRASKSSYTTVKSTSRTPGASASKGGSLTKPSTAMSTETVSKVESQTEPTEQQKCPSVLLDEFKAKIASCKGKGQIYPSHIPMVNYTSSSTSTQPQLRGIPKTYQQLGLAPLTRSPSSENYFLDVVSLLKGIEVPLPKKKSPSKSKAKKSTRDKACKKKSECCPVSQQRFIKGTHISRCDACPKSRSQPAVMTHDSQGCDV